MQGRKNFLPSRLVGLIIKSTQDRLTGGKKFRVVHTRVHKNMMLKEVTKAVFTRFRQRNNKFEWNWQAKKVWAWINNLVKKSQGCLYSLSALNFLFLVIGTSLYLLVHGGYLPHRRFIFCFQGNKGGSECHFCTGCLLNNFNSIQSIAQSGIFGGGLPWAL